MNVSVSIYELRGLHGEGGSWNRRTSSVDVQVRKSKDVAINVLIPKLMMADYNVFNKSVSICCDYTGSAKNGATLTFFKIAESKINRF